MNSVMILDDDRSLQLMVSALLSREGFAVSGATSLAEFDQRAAEQPCMLYIVDLGLPDGSGLDAVRAIRRKSSSGIIILSACDTENARVKGLELGADDYVAKPFRPREFAARVKALWRRTTMARETEVSAPPPGEKGVQLGPYRVLPESRRLTDPTGREILLTAAEFALLAVLMDAQGTLLHRDEIVARIHGRGWQCHERTVDGLVSRLRRKLPVARGTSHFIRTAHGRGYMLAP